jgi:hypothetical protein
MSTHSAHAEVSYDSDSAEDVIAGLMSLFDDVPDSGDVSSSVLSPVSSETEKVSTTIGIDSFGARVDLPTTLQLRDLKLNENGHCNFRDGTVLGKPPGLLIPEELRLFDILLLSIYLHFDTDALDTVTERACLVNAPVFCLENMKTTHGDLQHTYATAANQLWLRTSTLGADFVVQFKKRQWDLSRKFRKVAGTQWPTFTIVATPLVNGTLLPDKSIRTPAFEVRSKEQTNKTTAARGLAGAAVTKRRRTPETEQATQELQKHQSDIVQLCHEKGKDVKYKQDYESRLRFMIAIAETDPQYQQLHKAMVVGLERIRSLAEQSA